MKGVIFDLDGVIVDTAKYHYRGWKRLAEHLKVEFNEKKNEALKGLSRRDSLIALLGYTPSESRIREWSDIKNQFYLEYIQEINREDILPGSLRLLEEIRSVPDFKQALASSSRNAGTVLEKLNLAEYFDAVVDGNEVIKAKPDPELFLKAAAKLNIKPERIIVFEDAASGIQAAGSAGMRAVGIGKLENLSGADLIVRDLSEIDLAKIKKLFIETVVV
ncbi:MAG: beta-phosphoglucomutase [Spirochaetes bacterium]|nr:beta-phosphoglucomutase [Spirochaetota bacterium]